MITFPELNLEFNINKVAFSFFNINIYWYAIIIVLAIIIALIILKINENKCNIRFSIMIDLSIYLIPISFIGARIYYILFNPNPYIENPIEVFNIRNGGLAIYGGIIAGIITCYVFCKKRKINFLDLLDYLAPSLAIGQAIGRIGNFVNIEAYGTKTDNILRMRIYENGNYTEVHPTFLYESLSTLLIFSVLMILIRKRKFKGEIVCIYFILYSFARFWIEGLRIDSLMFLNFRISQILSLAIFAISIAILSYNVIKHRKMKNIIENWHTKKYENAVYLLKYW